ncbi:MAG: hypothetical protein U0350_16760 [Caldilineaceae bacterium]
MNATFAFQLNQLLDHYNNEHHKLESEFNPLPRQQALGSPGYYERAHRLAHEQANALAEIIDPQNQAEAAELLRHHPLHREVLLQSAFIRHAYLRPYGYPGDKDLMLMICNQPDEGVRNYAVLQNRVFLNLPAAAAVRQRICSMAHLLAGLPPKSKVLNIACGPALEVKQLCTTQPKRLVDFDLIDHDPRTIQYTLSTLGSQRVRHMRGNALYLAHGLRAVDLVTASGGSGAESKPLTEKYSLPTAHYDLVYTMGLYDYLIHQPDNATGGTVGLTSTLFALVKPGGRLIIGNYLETSPHNPHTLPHRLMMELYSNWQLKYRTPQEILTFLNAIDSNRHEVYLTNEYFDDPPLPRGAIGFLIITKQS